MAKHLFYAIKMIDVFMQYMSYYISHVCYFYVFYIDINSNRKTDVLTTAHHKDYNWLAKHTVAEKKHSTVHRMEWNKYKSVLLFFISNITGNKILFIHFSKTIFHLVYHYLRELFTLLISINPFSHECVFHSFFCDIT